MCRSKLYERAGLPLSFPFPLPDHGIVHEVKK